MAFYDSDERRKAITNYIAKLRDIATLYPVIVPVINSFDNKIYNVRFKNALAEASSSTNYHIFTEKRLNYMEIYVYDRGSQYTLAQVTIDDMPDGKRIPAEKLIESARNKREELLRRAYELENIDIKQVLDQLNQAKALYNSIYEGLPYKFIDVYHITHVW
jgi:hypothetical protein